MLEMTHCNHTPKIQDFLCEIHKKLQHTRKEPKDPYIRTSFSNSACLADHWVATALWIGYKNPTLKYNHMHWFLSQVQFLTHRHNKALWNEMLHNTVGHDNWFSNHHRTKLFEHIITCQWRYALAHLEWWVGVLHEARETLPASFASWMPPPSNYPIHSRMIIKKWVHVVLHFYHLDYNDSL
jgi:hypothetical protein